MADDEKKKGERKNKPSSKKAFRESEQRTSGETIKSLANSDTQVKGQKRKRHRQVHNKNKRNLTLYRKQNARATVLNQLLSQECFPSLEVLGVENAKETDWICSAKNQLIWKEQKHAVQENEVRVFIEGAEVSSYIRDSITWTLQGTGGMNTCSFTLNNNHDAFIITPLNVCSHLDTSGWRIGGGGDNPGRPTKDTDENAKYIIYRNKAERVFPPDGSKKNKNPQIDEAGQWLYPLGPWSPVFHKHDCVRVFYRLPHISGVGKKNKKGKIIDSREAWAPAFTGFINEYDFEDDPVTGDRRINISCYDYRGILDRMRVRTLGTGLVSKIKETDRSPLWDDAKAAAKKEGKKGDSKKFIDFANVAGVARDLNNLFNRVLLARSLAECADGDINCQHNLYIDIINDFRKDIKHTRNVTWIDPETGKKHTALEETGLKPDWLALDKAVQRANSDKRGRKYEREGEGPLKVVAQDTKGVNTASAAIPKAVKFIRDNGPGVFEFAYRYREAIRHAMNRVVDRRDLIVIRGKYYPNKEFSVLSPHSELSSVPGRGKYYGKKVNLYDTEEVKAVNAKLKSKYPKLYEGVVGGPISEEAKKELKATYPDFYEDILGREEGGLKVDPIYLMNYYMKRTVLSFFDGVGERIKQAIDENIKKETGFRVLLTAGSLPSSFGGGSVELVSFALAGTTPKVVKGLAAYKDSRQVRNVREAEEEISGRLEDFNNSLKSIQNRLDRAFAQVRQRLKDDPNLAKLARRRGLISTWNAAATQGKSNYIQNSGGAVLADLLYTDAKFTTISSGIYADLVRAIEKDKHPLAGLSFEMGVTWLTATNSLINVGFFEKMNHYHSSRLQDWNLNVLFGVVGRAYTWDEVSLFGEQCVTEVKRDDAPLSPVHAFMHMLVPQDGTGAQTLIQQDITANAAAAKSYDWETRLALLNSLCETLDYQFFVSPIGDLIFEFPNYSSLPTDYGKIFQGAYTATMGIRNFRCTEETGECNTAWVLTGNEDERILNDIGQTVIKEKFKKQVIIADGLARRIGVKVRYLEIPIPGVGSLYKGSVERTLSSILAYGLLEMQREIGRMSTFSVQHEFRPYMVPNRPFHVTHRHRLGLTQSVTYSMNPPIGGCEVSSDVYYVRKLQEDGTFRLMTGGTRMPVDYSGLFTGNIKQTLKWGAIPLSSRERNPHTFQQSKILNQSVLETQGRSTARARTNLSCGPFLKDRYIESADPNSDQVGNLINTGSTYSSQTSGSQGSAGTLPPMPRRQMGALASRDHKPADNTGQPDAVVDTRNTGVRIKEKKDEKDKPDSSEFIGNLYNPWPYGVRKPYAIFNQFGLFRMLKQHSDNKDIFYPANRSSFGNNYKGSAHSGWHGGIDFNGIRIGTPCYSPIPLKDIRAYLFSGDTNSGKPTRWFHHVVAESTDITDPANYPPVVKKFGIRDDNGIPVHRTKGVGPGTVKHSFWIDKAAEDLYYRVMKKAKKTNTQGYTLKVIPNGYKGAVPNTGLLVEGVGITTMPGDSSKPVACKLRYMHCSMPGTSESNVLFGSVNTPAKERQAPADSVIALSGKSGVSASHLHFAMQIYAPGEAPPKLGGQTDSSAWKEIEKANADFLRTQVRLKLTAGQGINSNKFSPHWKRYFTRANRKGLNITTVDQAVDYIIKNRANVKKRYNSLISPNKQGLIPVNPFHYFKPEQIIKSHADKYKAYRKKWGKITFGESSGGSICGKSSQAVQQKIALEYSACRGKVRKLKSKSKQREARKECKAEARAAKKESKIKFKDRKQVRADKAERKLDSKVKSDSKNPDSGLRSDT